MADFSQEECHVITTYPLGDSLARHRDKLRAIEDSYQTGRVTDEKEHRAVIAGLLQSLVAQSVALRLSSRSGGAKVAIDLAIVFDRAWSSDFDYVSYRALVRLVIDGASDLEIWRAVVDLITLLNLISPLHPKAPSRPKSPHPTISPSTQGTPIKHNSSSVQDHEQTEKILKVSLFNEIRYCTFRKVEGFFEKYFEAKDWSVLGQEIYANIEHRHMDGRWADFPQRAVEGDVLEWIFKFQKDYLSEAPGAYYSTQTPKDLTGAEAQYQIDLLLKRRSIKDNQKHDWNDILVVGELKQSNRNFKDRVIQLSRYVRQVFISQPTRHFVHGFFLCGAKMELFVFDRSGPYSSGEFDIHNEPEKFIRALAGYALMYANELGVYNFLEQEGDDHFVQVTAAGTGKRLKIAVDPKPMFNQRAIYSRGTTCFRSKNRQQIIKLSWPSALRTKEAKHLLLAQEHGVEGVAKLVGDSYITSTKQMREGLTFPARHRFRSTPFDSSHRHDSASTSKSSSDKCKSSDMQTTSLKKLKSSRAIDDILASHGQTPKLKNESGGESGLCLDSFTDRALSCLVISPAGRPIYSFTSVKELLTALRDAIKAHRSLLENAEILHRDISENNIIITDPKTTGCTGMLIDLDLAIVSGARPGGTHMTGTKLFKAIDVLRGNAHTYRHDLESFFYVFLWICAQRAWQLDFLYRKGDQQDKEILLRWKLDELGVAASIKENDMTNRFQDVLEAFPSALRCVAIKTLCLNLRETLFPMSSTGVDLSTPKEPRLMYDPIIEAFNTAITEIAAQTVQTEVSQEH